MVIKKCTEAEIPDLDVFVGGVVLSLGGSGRQHGRLGVDRLLLVGHLLAPDLHHDGALGQQLHKLQQTRNMEAHPPQHMILIILDSPNTGK